jgi:signal transduction histidine kinase
MSGLPARVALCIFGLLCALLAFAVGTVGATTEGAEPGALARCALQLALLPLLAAGFAGWRVSAFARELAALSAHAREPLLHALPTPRFHESAGLFDTIAALTNRTGADQQAQAGIRQRFSAAQMLRARFIAAMGHDLRSPLNAMLGFADLLALSRPADWHAAQHTNLEIIRQRARDLLALIDAMVDWAKLEARELPLELGNTDVQQVLQQAVELAEQRSGSRGLRVRTELASELGQVRADRKHLTQALLGLMDHAARSDDGPTITLRARVVNGDTGKTLRVELFDPALEFREEDRLHLFEAFRPSFAPTGKRIAGLSLGTAIARALVREQGGDVWFESRPERGTTFVLTLPATC